MKKSIMKIACLTMALTAGATALSSCAVLSGNTTSGGDLIITYYKGGYGSQWIEYAVREFEKEKNIAVLGSSHQFQQCVSQNSHQILTKMMEVIHVFHRTSHR